MRDPGPNNEDYLRKQNPNMTVQQIEWLLHHEAEWWNAPDVQALRCQPPGTYEVLTCTECGRICRPQLCPVGVEQPFICFDCDWVQGFGVTTEEFVQKLISEGGAYADC